MDDAAPDTEERYAQQRLGQLCRRLGEAAGPLSYPGPMQELAERIAAQIRDGGRASELAADLDELEELLLQERYAAGLSEVRSSYAPLPGVSAGHPVLTVLACPTGQCARIDPPDDDGEAQPACRVLGRPLRRVRLHR